MNAQMRAWFFFWSSFCGGEVGLIEFFLAVRLIIKRSNLLKV